MLWKRYTIIVFRLFLVRFILYRLLTSQASLVFLEKRLFTEILTQETNKCFWQIVFFRISSFKYQIKFFYLNKSLYYSNELYSLFPPLGFIYQIKLVRHRAFPNQSIKLLINSIGIVNPESLWLKEIYLWWFKVISLEAPETQILNVNPLSVI